MWIWSWLFALFQLTSSLNYSNIICNNCNTKINYCSLIQSMLINNQEKLYRFVEQQHFSFPFKKEPIAKPIAPDVKIDACLVADPFKNIEMKTEEIVIKVECEDYDTNMELPFNEHPSPEKPKINIEVAKKSNMKRPTNAVPTRAKRIFKPRTITKTKWFCKFCSLPYETSNEYLLHLVVHRKSSEAFVMPEVQPGFRFCPLCEKTMKVDSIAKHVSDSICKTSRHKTILFF